MSDLQEQIKGLQDDRAKLVAVRERATHGLAFARRHQEMTEGFPMELYWSGKVDAYGAILDTIDGAV